VSLQEKIARLVRPEIQVMSAYHVPPAQGMIKLDAMENPWPWPQELRAAWLEALRGVELNRYPDPSAHELQAELRAVMAVPPAAGVMLGNGSDELIQMIIQTLAAPGRVVMAPEPTFVMYRQLALVAGMSFAGVPLCDDFSLDVTAMLEAIAVRQPAVIFLAFPNNPTGNLFDAGVIRQILDEAPGLVVVDEAYAPFTDHSYMARLGQHDNLLVMRTVSKMGLAGLRLGLLAGPRDWLAEIDKTRLPYNVNVLTQAVADLALAHPEVLEEQTRAIRAERARLLGALRRLPGLTVYPSEANFILLRTAQGRASAVFEGLKTAKVLIKKLDGGHPMLADCLRVTVGTPQENDVFLEALGRLL